VLCLRDVRQQAEQRARWVLVGIFGLLVSTCGALFALRSLRTTAARELPRTLPTMAARAEPPATDVPRFDAAESAVPSTDLAKNEPDWPSEQPVPVPSIISSVPAPAPSAGRVQSARVPSQRELLTALRATPVSMFSTSWCPHCERARRFFRANGMSVVDRDVDTDAQAAVELKRRSGSKAVPLIDVDGRELKGFDERATRDAVVASVERRLGITGIKLTVTSVSTRAE